VCFNDHLQKHETYYLHSEASFSFFTFIQFHENERFLRYFMEQKNKMCYSRNLCSVVTDVSK
jgi:hypothetical protein